MLDFLTPMEAYDTGTVHVSGKAGYRISGRISGTKLRCIVKYQRSVTKEPDLNKSDLLQTVSMHRYLYLSFSPKKKVAAIWPF
jgi:hypothetical protein